MPTALKIVVFIGSVRNGRMGERVAKFVERIVEQKGMEPILLDPLEMNVGQVHQPLHFMQNAETEAPEWMKSTNVAIQEADGFLIVASEYNCGIPPALSNLMDAFPPTSYRHRPCGLITYSMGQFGGIRSSTILRPFVSELGMVSVPKFAVVPEVHTVFDAEGKTTNERVEKSITQVIAETEWYAKALKSFKEDQNLPPT